jgi:hypothetical protein
VLFLGRMGKDYCYGEGTHDQSRHRQRLPTAPAVVYCYDPFSLDKGTHGYPYVYQVWAYDALDLVAVAKGKKDPWAVRPYAAWTLDLPFQRGDGLIGGVAYDPATQRLFLSALRGEGMAPLIHVFTLAMKPQGSR